MAETVLAEVVGGAEGQGAVDLGLGPEKRRDPRGRCRSAPRCGRLGWGRAGDGPRRGGRRCRGLGHGRSRFTEGRVRRRSRRRGGLGRSQSPLAEGLRREVRGRSCLDHSRWLLVDGRRGSKASPNRFGDLDRSRWPFTDGGRCRGRWRYGRLDLDRAHPVAIRPGLPPPRVMEPAALGREDVEVDHQQVLLELGAAGHDPPRGVDDEAVPVEDQLVLAPDGVAEGHEAAVVGRPLGEHAFPLDALAPVVRRAGQVDEDHRAAVDRRPAARPPRIPQVLADGDADADAAEVDGEGGVAPGEVPLLVEHRVVRQEVLSIDGGDLAAREHRGRVVEVAGEVRQPDHRHRSGRRRREAAHPVRRRLREPRVQQQVLGRIPGGGELGKDGQVGAAFRGAGDQVAEPVEVPREIADGQVALAEGHPQGGAVGSGPVRIGCHGVGDLTISLRRPVSPRRPEAVPGPGRLRESVRLDDTPADPCHPVDPKPSPARAVSDSASASTTSTATTGVTTSCATLMPCRTRKASRPWLTRRMPISPR